MTATQYTGDNRIIGTLDGNQAVVREFDVKSGTTASIAEGDFVTVDNSNPGYVKTAANGASSALEWIGVCVKASDETAGADGTCEVAFSPSGLIVRGTPTTPGNLAQSVKLTLVTLDVTTGTQTIDENDTSSGVLRVLTYDDTSGEETIDVVCPCHLNFVS